MLKLLLFFLIGHGDELIKYLPSPKTIDSLRRVNVKNVYAGGDVSFVIDQNGRLFGFGDGKKRKMSVSYIYTLNDYPKQTDCFYICVLI